MNVSRILIQAMRCSILEMRKKRGPVFHIPTSLKGAHAPKNTTKPVEEFGACDPVIGC